MDLRNQVDVLDILLATGLSVNPDRTLSILVHSVSQKQIGLIILERMAMNGIIVAPRKNNRLVLATTTLVAICLVAVWQNDLLSASIRPQRLSVSRGNQSRTSRFVSLCSANFDRRRLGNQLFNWAAVLYVARLTGDAATTACQTGRTAGCTVYSGY